jgi:hypothetical protein
MKIIVEISEKELSFGLKVLRNLGFVKKVRPISNAASELWENLLEASEDVQLHKQGKKKLKTAQELLDEL